MAGFHVRALPLPEGAASCGPAIAISGDRIVGSCKDARDGAERAVLWQQSSDGPAWPVAALLEPAGSDLESHASALSGDLAVGWSRTAEGRRPVAWRLP